MKAKDLMIGDWVCCNGHNEQVVEITKTALVTDKWAYDYGNGIKPIPLTAEILEKNGFERCATAPSFWLVGDLYYGTLLGISEDSYEDTWHVSTFKDHNDNDWILSKVCYVHELQHILKLLDIDKEIEL